ncbi:MAG: hypothetical protein MI861_07385 [Pirellulales bacterium]|nr:hypothetical protein [Pirellulales bacterium]
MNTPRKCECRGMEILSHLERYDIRLDHEGLCFLNDALCNYCVFCGGLLKQPPSASGLDHSLGKLISGLQTLERVLDKLGAPDEIVEFDELAANNPVMVLHQETLHKDWNRLIRYRRRLGVVAIDIYEKTNGELEVHIIE